MSSRTDLMPLYRGLFLVVVACFVALPLLATVLGGFKSLGELRTSPFGIPHVWEWENYTTILTSSRSCAPPSAPESTRRMPRCAMHAPRRPSRSCNGSPHPPPTPSSSGVALR